MRRNKTMKYVGVIFAAVFVLAFHCQTVFSFGDPAKDAKELSRPKKETSTGKTGDKAIDDFGAGAGYKYSPGGSFKLGAEYDYKEDPPAPLGAKTPKVPKGLEDVIKADPKKMTTGEIQGNMLGLAITGGAGLPLKKAKEIYNKWADELDAREAAGEDLEQTDLMKELRKANMLPPLKGKEKAPTDKAQGKDEFHLDWKYKDFSSGLKYDYDWSKFKPDEKGEEGGNDSEATDPDLDWKHKKLLYDLKLKYGWADHLFYDDETTDKDDKDTKGDETYEIDPEALKEHFKHSMGGGMTEIDPPTLLDPNAPVEPLPDSVIDDLQPFDLPGSVAGGGGVKSTSKAHPKDPKKLPKTKGMKDSDIDEEIKKLQKNKKEFGKYFSKDAQQRLLDLIEERNRRKKAKASGQNTTIGSAPLSIDPYGVSISTGYVPSSDVQIQNRYSVDGDIQLKEEWIDEQARIKQAEDKKLEGSMAGSAATDDAYSTFGAPDIKISVGGAGGSSGRETQTSGGGQDMSSSPAATTSQPASTPSLTAAPAATKVEVPKKAVPAASSLCSVCGDPSCPGPNFH